MIGAVMTTAILTVHGRPVIGAPAMPR